ncbi:MAG: hypothetical protein ABJE47_00255 [bacterium]
MSAVFELFSSQMGDKGIAVKSHRMSVVVYQLVVFLSGSPHHPYAGASPDRFGSLRATAGLEHRPKH